MTTAIVPLAVGREAIERCDIAGAMALLVSLSSSRDVVLANNGVLDLAFEGYDADPRPIGEIPEVRRWFVRLIQRWNYWVFFIKKDGEAVRALLSLLTPPGASLSDHALMDGAFENLRVGLRELVAAFSIDHETELDAYWRFMDAVDAVELNPTPRTLQK